MSNGGKFQFGDDAVALPKGAWARTERRTLRWNGRPVLSLSQGRHRAYVCPLYTPKGFAVTSECPADHPHHNSLWIAADHVHCQMPAAGDRFEDYTYNFYLDETFQGRAPGRIVETGVTSERLGANGFQIAQTLEWRGPVEWAAPMGRVAATEARIFRIEAAPQMLVIDLESQLSAVEWGFTIGPTRHAYFNVRVAESIAVMSGGAIIDDRGVRDADAITGAGSRWIDYSGPVGGGALAGVAVCPDPRDHDETTWFVTDWGVVTGGPFRNRSHKVEKGASIRLRYRVLVHDGDAKDAKVAERLHEYLASATA
jgi:Methane oxygenase PmoA